MSFCTGSSGICALDSTSARGGSGSFHATGIVNLLSGLSSARLVCDTRGMSPLSINRYKHYRLPAEIISHGVWLYYRFCLSYRAVEELLFARGIIVSILVIIVVTYVAS
jgi:hypothetical protein